MDTLDRHSPAPWEITPVGSFIRSGNQIIAILATRNPNADKDNALIAAAPDLLAACKAVVGYGPDEVIQQVHAAIEKAEGRGPGGRAPAE